MKATMPSRSALFTAAALAIIQFCSSGAADAAVLPHANLQDLVRKAERVFIGTCVSVTPGVVHFDDVGQLGYTEYRFVVHDWIKGGRERSSMIVFRQPRALPERTRQANLSLSFRASGDAFLKPVAYVAGQKYLLFLHPSNKWGLTAPVGSVQGSFLIRLRPDGGQEAVNGIDNLGLFRELPDASQSAAPLGLRERELFRQGKGAASLEALLPLARGLAELPSNR